MKSKEKVNEEGFKAILRDYSSNIAEIALAARALVLSVLPEAYEVVWTRQGNTGYGIGPKKMTEHFCYISPAKAHVTFGFNHGSQLKDPHGILEGAGAAFRHVKLGRIEDVHGPELRALVHAAVEERKKSLA